MGKGSLGAGKSVYAFGIKADHSGIVKADGTTAAALIGDAELHLGGDRDEYINTEITLTPADDGTVAIKIVTTQYDSTMLTFKNKYFPLVKSSATTTKPELKSVTGTTIGGGTASGNKECYILVYGGNDGTNVTVNGYVVQWKKSSLAKSYKGGEWNTYTMEGTSVAALAAITIPIALFDAGIVTVPLAAKTHAINAYEFEELMAKAA